MARQSFVASRTRPAASERRTAILNAARELVVQHGFRDAQMTTVADRAGVALQTLYRYFPSKIDLMEQVVALVAQREVEAVATVAAGVGSPAERFSTAAWVFASRAVRGRKMAHALLSETVDSEIDAARRKYARKLARVFESLIEEGIRSGDFPLQDPAGAAECVVGSLFYGLVGPLVMQNLGISEPRFAKARAVVAFCVRAVSGPNKALRLVETSPRGARRVR